MPRYLSLISALLCCISSHGQQKFNLTIQLDSTLSKENITCRYYNGKNNVDITDTFKDRSLNIKGDFYSEKAIFTISYQNNKIIAFKESFFISSKPARIAITRKPENTYEKWAYLSLINAIPIFNAAYNPLFRELVNFRSKEESAVSKLWETHGDRVMYNDNLRKQNTILLKALNKRCMLFLRQHSNDYFSFYFFKDQIVQAAISMNPDDRNYFKELISNYQNIFPDKYLKSIEGNALMAEMNIYANAPYKTGDAAPKFEIKDIAGNLISPKTNNSSFTLLIFWQTWCGPCLQEIPSLIDLRKNYPIDSLEMISITNEVDYNKIAGFIKSHNMNWKNIWDKENRLTPLYRVNAYPTMFLIDRSGTIKSTAKGLSDTEWIHKSIDREAP